MGFIINEGPGEDLYRLIYENGTASVTNLTADAGNPHGSDFVINYHWAQVVDRDYVDSDVATLNTRIDSEVAALESSIADTQSDADGAQSAADDAQSDANAAQSGVDDLRARVDTDGVRIGTGASGQITNHNPNTPNTCLLYTSDAADE